MPGNDRDFGRVRVVFGRDGGKYPQGNSLLVLGTEASALLDPALIVRERAGEFVDNVDLMLLSHVHEDHIAGASLLSRQPIYAHREDCPGMHSLDGLMEMYGHGLGNETMREMVRQRFFYQPRPDIMEFEDGSKFDLGGSCVHVIHSPGHTRGHSCFLIEPEGVLFLADIDLTGFGPYYGDAWSDLGDFERTLDMVEKIPARIWVTFHQAGVVEDRQSFLEALARFRGRIQERERALLAFLSEGARTVEQMVEHRFLFPKHVRLWYVEAAERRTIEQHLARLEGEGRIKEVEGNAYVRVG